MATAPTYEGAKKHGSLILDSGAGTGVSVSTMAGGTNGTRVKEIRIHSAGTVAPGANKKLAVILDDQVNQTVVDIVSISNTKDIRQAILRYDNLNLASAMAQLKFQMTAALDAGATLHILVEAADF